MIGLLGRIKCVMCGVYNNPHHMSVIYKRVGICQNCRGKIKTTKDKTFDGNNVECVIAPFDYDGELADAVKAFKFGRQELYGKLFAKILCEEIIHIEFLKEFDMVVPVPLHEERLKDRGFNQAEILAEPIAENLNIPLRTDVLIRTKNTKHQSSLYGYDRVLNVQDAFLADMIEVQGKNILLVDDIYTMGETVASCSRALKDAGALRIAAVALCKTPFKKPPVTLRSLQ